MQITSSSKKSPSCLSRAIPSSRLLRTANNGKKRKGKANLESPFLKKGIQENENADEGKFTQNWRTEMGEGEEIIEIGELRRHVDRRHVELVGNGRKCSFQDRISNWAGGIKRLLLMLMLLVLSESCGAGYDVQQPSYVRNGLLLCGVLLCTGRELSEDANQVSL